MLKLRLGTYTGQRNLRKETKKSQKQLTGRLTQVQHQISQELSSQYLPRLQGYMPAFHRDSTCPFHLPGGGERFLFHTKLMNATTS